MVANPKDIPRPYYSLDEYFALEHASDARYEYWDGEIVCMSGGLEAHYRISFSVPFHLRRKLAGGPCQAFILMLLWHAASSSSNQFGVSMPY